MARENATTPAPQSGLAPAGTEERGHPVRTDLETTSSSHSSWSRDLLFLCFAFVFVRLPFMFTVPMVEAPDEFAHYWVIRFIKEHWRLPSATEVAAGSASAVYGSLPQLGYLPHLAVSALSSPQTLPLYERFGSLLGGLVLLYSAYHIGKELFPNKRLLQMALPAVLIFHPQLAFLHAYANNDSTSSALSGVLLLLTLRSIRRGITVQRSLLVGLLLGWLALSKYSGLAVVPAVAFGLIAAAAMERTPLPRLMAAVTACIGACAVTCGWWFVRNVHEFAGDMLGTKTMFTSWALTFHKDLHYYEPPSHIIKSLRWWRMMFYSYWAMFGYMTKYIWRPAYLTYVGYLIASVAGLLLTVVQPGRLRSATTARSIVGWCCMALTIVANLCAMIWASTGNLGGPQGRYLFTSEVPIAALMLLGLYKLGGKHGSKVVFSFVVFNMAVCFGSLVMLCRLYGFHATPLQ
ncbi:MAG TPA: hypothetical protein V6D22_18525 [Candidatus Obscuribacterales bacterium]